MSAWSGLTWGTKRKRKPRDIDPESRYGVYSVPNEGKQMPTPKTAARTRRKIRHAVSISRVTALVFLGIIVFGALLLWGLIDFDGLFTAFHRIAFTNEGWLLDARTDLLLRLMPVDFFIALAAKILLWTAAAAIVVFAAVRIILRVRKDELR